MTIDTKSSKFFFLTGKKNMKDNISLKLKIFSKQNKNNEKVMFNSPY